MDKFQYMTMTIDKAGSYESSEYVAPRPPYDDGYFRWCDLDKLGADGWQLVAVVFDPSAEQGTGFFMRKLVEHGN